MSVSACLRCGQVTCSALRAAVLFSQITSFAPIVARSIARFLHLPPLFSLLPACAHLHASSPPLQWLARSPQAPPPQWPSTPVARPVAPPLHLQSPQIARGSLRLPVQHTNSDTMVYHGQHWHHVRHHKDESLILPIVQPLVCNRHLQQSSDLEREACCL